MVTIEPDSSVIAHSIQLSVGPVFLLSGIACMVAVITARLSRIVEDRCFRHGGPHEGSSGGAESETTELEILLQRGRLVSGSVGLWTLTAHSSQWLSRYCSSEPL